MTTDELDPEVMALIDALYPRPRPPKPKVVVSDNRVVRDVEVVVSPRDWNAKHGMGEVCIAKAPEPEWLTQEMPVGRGRFDHVTVDLALAERQQEDRRRARPVRPGRDVDPMGVWGVAND